MLSRIKNRLIGCGLLALIHDELTARTHQNLNFWGGGGGGGASSNIQTYENRKDMPFKGEG
jgi:hypothetical protein